MWWCTKIDKYEVCAEFLADIGYCSRSSIPCKIILLLSKDQSMMNRGSGETFLSFPKGVTVFGKMTTLESFSHSANILGSDSAQVVSAPLKSWEAQDRKVLHQNLFFSSRNRVSSIFHPNPDKQCWM